MTFMSLICSLISILIAYSCNGGILEEIRNVRRESDQFNFEDTSFLSISSLICNKYLLQRNSLDVFFENFSSHRWRIIRTKREAIAIAPSFPPDSHINCSSVNHQKYHHGIPGHSDGNEIANTFLLSRDGKFKHIKCISIWNDDIARLAVRSLQ
jgi:hypothetical protein